MDCPLCRAEVLTPRLHDDAICWAAYCATHPSKVIVVLRRHTTTPTKSEFEHLYRVADEIKSGVHWRGPHSIPEHFHLHEK